MIPNFTLVVEAAVFLTFIWIAVQFVWPMLLRPIEGARNLYQSAAPQGALQSLERRP